MPVDLIRRAGRGDDASGDGLQRIGIGRATGDDGELVAAEAGHQILAAHDVAQPLGDVEDERVADVVAERIVDVLEVIEIDVEHRRREAAGAHVVDGLLEPLGEVDAVGQAGNRVVQGEVTQLPLAGGDGGRGAPHIADHQADQDGEAGKRYRDEGNDTCDDRGARPRRRPGNAGDGVTLGVGKFRDPIRVGLCRIVDQTQPAELQAIADLTEQTVADVFDGEGEPTADAETMAGRPRKRWIMAVLRPGFEGPCASSTWIAWPGTALRRPRKRSSTGADSARKSAAAISAATRELAYLI